MEYAYSLGGGTPVIKKYQIGATVSNVGIPLRETAADGAGLLAGTTTSAADFVGMNLDTATYVTAQQTDGSSAMRRISIILNPDAVWKARLSGGATENTALTLYDVTTASAAGTAITTGDAWDNPTYDEGIVWGYDGANAGQFRKITSVSSTAGTVTVAFDYDTVVGDNFMRAPFWHLQGDTLQLTTNLYQVDASIAVGTGAQYKAIWSDLRDEAGDGRNNSFVYFIANDHALRETT